MFGQTSDCSVLQVLTHLSVRSNRNNHLHVDDSVVIRQMLSYIYTLDYADSPKQRLLQ